MMTTTEFRLFLTSAILMMMAMAMLLSVMIGEVPADVARTPIMVTGMISVAAFAVMRSMQYLRVKIA